MTRVQSWIGLLGCAVLVGGFFVVVHFFGELPRTGLQPSASRPIQACASVATAALPASFVAVRAERCVETTVAVPGDGEWRVLEDQRVDGGLAALVTALRTPSQRAVGLCAEPAVVMPELSLVDAHGRRVRPEIPTSGCGGPLRAVTQAIDALSWRTVASDRLRRIRTQLEVDSGCPGAYKPVVPMDAARGTAGGGPVDLGDPTALGVCRYLLDQALAIDGYQGGLLVGADRLTGKAMSAVLVAIRSAKPVPGTCDRPQQPFAVLMPAGAGIGPVVELGGCDRMDVDGHLYQLDATTVSVLYR